MGIVLDELGYTDTPQPDTDWPHVWWVVSGWFNHLPIHASGDHKPGSKLNALDRVISSYIPTLKALAYSRNRPTSTLSRRVSEAMFVGMSETPRQSNLPYVHQEREDFNNILPDSVQRHLLNSPSKALVLARLQNCDLSHFACHGQYMSANPSESYLMLHDWEEKPLAVAASSA